MAPKWQRPENVSIPTVWRRCETRKPLADGTMCRFRIQDISEDMDEDVVQFMTANFLKDEPINAVSRFVEDPTSVAEVHDIWRSLLRQRVSLVALVEGEEGQRPRIAGINVIGITNKDDQLDIEQFQGNVIKKVMRLVVEHVNSLVDPFQLYGIDHYMTAMGLSVDPDFRGQGLGLELLKARFDVAKAVGIKVTMTVFTAIASQVLAHKAGFELIKEFAYEDYQDENGNKPFPNMATKTVKIMAKVIE